MIDTVERHGEVVGFERGLAQVRLERPSGCSGCGSRGTCASGSAATQVIHMALPHPAKLGDHVCVSMPSSSVALAALLGYLLPPTGLLVGAIIADTCFARDAAAVLGAGLGFVSGLLLARLVSYLTFGRNIAPSVCRTDFQPGEHL
jgi:sigma-E factor negative regulatory protein RseC